MAANLTIIQGGKGRTTKGFVQIIPGHHQHGDWPPYKALLKPFTEAGWNTVITQGVSDPAPIEGRLWSHPKISDEDVLKIGIAEYALGIDEMKAQAAQELRKALPLAKGVPYVLLVHSLHTQIAYELAQEYLKARSATVITLMPTMDLLRERDYKLQQIGIKSIDDERFKHGGAVHYYDAQTGQTRIKVYTTSRFWNGYQRRIEEAAAETAVNTWRGKSIIVYGENDKRCLPDAQTVIDASPREPIVLSYPCSHRPSSEQMGSIGQNLVERLC